MNKAFLLAFALAIALDIPAANGLQMCDAESSKKCSEDPNLIKYLALNPGKCEINECAFKPKRGYTENPDENFQVYFQPAKFTKKIAFSFKEFDAKVCAYRNQMCVCDTRENCKCDMKVGSVCRQQYSTERAYFLVFDDTPRQTPMKPQSPPPRPPKSPYRPQYGYPPQKYDYFPPPQFTPPPPPTKGSTIPPPPPPPPSHGQGMYPFPGMHQSNSHMSGQSGGGNAYQIPMPNKRSMMMDYLGGGGGMPGMPDMGEMLGMPGMAGMPGMPGMPGLPGMSGMFRMPGAGLLSKLFDGDDKEGSGGGDGGDKKGDIFKYILMSQLMNKNKYYPQDPYHHHPHPHPPATPPPPPQPTGAPPPPPPPQQTFPDVGSYFDPKILMYMLSKKGGSGSKGFYRILPYLTGAFGSKYKLKLATLYIKVPSGCECKNNTGREIDPFLKYFFLLQRPPQYQSPGLYDPFQDSPYKTSQPKFPFGLGKLFWPKY